MEELQGGEPARAGGAGACQPSLLPGTGGLVHGSSFTLLLCSLKFRFFRKLIFKMLATNSKILKHHGPSEIYLLVRYAITL